MDQKDATHFIDTSNDLTIDEVHQLKKLAKYYGAGQIILAVMIGLGAGVLGLLQAVDYIHKWIGK